MMKNLTIAMKASISEVMETMFFLPVECEQESTLSPSQMSTSAMACQLGFSGDFSGHFTLFVQKDLLVEMTESFMGEPQERLENELLLGTMTETLNMICGNALSRVNPKTPFELDIPKVIDTSDLLETQVFTIVNTPQYVMAISITID